MTSFWMRLTSCKSIRLRRLNHIYTTFMLDPHVIKSLITLLDQTLKDHQKALFTTIRHIRATV